MFASWAWRSKHRTEKSKFRLQIQRAAQALIAALQEYNCDSDPAFGDKPAQLGARRHRCPSTRHRRQSAWPADACSLCCRATAVQSHSKRLIQLLTDNLGRVAPKGDIKIGARKKHESKLELKPGGKVVTVQTARCSATLPLHQSVF